MGLDRSDDSPEFSEDFKKKKSCKLVKNSLS